MTKHFNSGLLLSKTLFGSLIPIPIILFAAGGRESINTAHLLSILAFLLLLTTRGVSIDTANRKIRIYISILGIKLGKWKASNQFSYYRVKTSNKNVNIIGSAGITKGYSYSKKILSIHDKKRSKDTLLSKKGNDIPFIIDHIKALGIEKIKFRKHRKTYPNNTKPQN